MPCMCVDAAILAEKSMRVRVHVYALGVYAVVNEVDAVDKVNTVESMIAGSKKSRVTPCRVHR